jgi:hypothetical protein
MLFDLTRDQWLNEHDSELTRWLDQIAVERFEDQRYSMSTRMKENLNVDKPGHPIKVNVGNIFRNA